MASPNGFAGTVVSGGPGNGPYVVQLVGVTDPVQVTQMQIDSGETIPAGTKVLVVKVGSAYYMQVPVWLE